MAVTVVTEDTTIVVGDTDYFDVIDTVLVVGQEDHPVAAFKDWKLVYVGLPSDLPAATEQQPEPEPEPVVYEKWNDVPEGAIVRSVNHPMIRFWRVDDLHTKSRLDSEDEWFFEDSNTLEINLVYSPFTLEAEVDE